MINVFSKDRRWVLRSSRSLFVLIALGASILFAPSASALEYCDPDTSCVYVYATADERQFQPLFIMLILICSVQLIMLILAITKPFDLLGKRGRDVL